MRYLRIAAVGCTLALLSGSVDARSTGGFSSGRGGGMPSAPRSYSPPTPSPSRIAPSAPSAPRTYTAPAPNPSRIQPSYAPPKIATPPPAAPKAPSYMEDTRRARDRDDARQAHEAIERRKSEDAARARQAQEAERARRAQQETKPAAEPKRPTHPPYRDDPPKTRPATEQARERDRDYVPHTNLPRRESAQPRYVQRDYIDNTSVGGGIHPVYWMILMQQMQNNQERERRARDEWTYRHWDRMSPSQRDELARSDPEIVSRHREFADQGVSRDPKVFVQGIDDKMAKVPEKSGYGWLWFGLLIIVGAGVFLIWFNRRDAYPTYREPATPRKREPDPVPAKPKVPEVLNPLKFKIGGYVEVDTDDCRGYKFTVERISEITLQIGVGGPKPQFVDYSLKDKTSNPAEHKDGFCRTIRVKPRKGGKPLCYLLRPYEEMWVHKPEAQDFLKELESRKVRDVTSDIVYDVEPPAEATCRELSRDESDAVQLETIELTCWDSFSGEAPPDAHLYLVEYDKSDEKGLIHTYLAGEIPVGKVKGIAGHK